MGVKDIHQRLLGVLGCLTFLYLLYHVKSGETDNQDLGKICKSESKEDSMIENPKPKAEMPNEATQRKEVEKDDKLRVVEDVMAVLRAGEAAQVTALINLKVSIFQPGTLPTYHPVTLSPCFTVSLSLCHPVTLSSRHPVNPSPCHPVTLSP